MDGSIAPIYKKQKYTYIPPTPPNDLIGCNSYTLDFNDRKFIQIGIDPKKSFSVMIHIITPSRYVSITSHYMKTIYTLMGDILSSVMEKPENTQTTFLSDTNLSLTKMVYKDENVLVIESQAVNGCRILLNRRDLMKLAELEYIVHECVEKHLAITTENVYQQIEMIIKYYMGCFFPTKETSRTELLRCIMEVSCITITSAIEPMSEPNYISEIKRFAAEELADVWMKKIIDRNDMPKVLYTFFYFKNFILFNYSIKIFF